MTALPTFFFSYARLNNEGQPTRYLAQFFRDLETTLADWAGHKLSEGGSLGTIDLRTRHGDDWDDELSEGLANDRALVMIETPLYYNRPNCGKELGVFLARIPGIKLDDDGALKGIRNVMRIRWLPEEAYGPKNDRQAKMPKILGKISDRPQQDPNDDDPELKAAIKKYVQKGMQGCVDTPHYYELLNSFVATLLEMAELAAGSRVNFANARDAFKFDWQTHFGPPPPAQILAVPEPAPAPAPISSVVAYHVTCRLFLPALPAVDFAEQLISEDGGQSMLDPELAAVMGHLRAAAAAERLEIFNAAPPSSIAAHVAKLTSRGVSALIVIDPAIWSSGQAAQMASSLAALASSSEWAGAFVSLGPSSPKDPTIASLLAPWRDRVIELPPTTSERILMLRRLMSEVRGAALRKSGENKNSGDSLPMLGGGSTPSGNG